MAAPVFDIGNIVQSLHGVRAEWRAAQGRSSEPGGREFRSHFNGLQETQEQCANVREFFGERHRSLGERDAKEVAA